MAKQPLSYAGPVRPETELRTQKRAVGAAWWGLAMQGVLALVAMVLYSAGDGATPLLSVFSFALYGLIPWLAILIASAFRRAQSLEDFEHEAARRTGEADRTIFASEADARPAARRLKRVYKWGLPVAAALLGLMLAWRGFWGLQSAADPGVRYDLTNARYLAGLFAGFAFVGFVLGRYVLGMSTSAGWSTLRGGATYLIATVYIFALMALAAGAAALGTDVVNGVVRFIVPLFALLVGAEVLLNIVLDLYRPKTADETPRPAFDSRLLSLLASPGDVVQSLNEAVNYQFGFEITRSWFWRLLSRSFGWLVLFGVTVLILLSCLVIVEPHEMALLTSFGELRKKPLEPGVTVTWPWPLASANKFAVTRINEMVVGSHDRLHTGEPLLWTNQHADAEVLLIVAGGDDEGEVGDGSTEDSASNGSGATLFTAALASAELIQRSGPIPVPRLPAGPAPVPVDAAAAQTVPPVALAAADVFVQWKIDPARLLEFATSSVDPEQRIRQLANAAVTRELLKHDIDAAIGVGRPEIARAIGERLRESVEAENLGVEIVWVGLVSVHPPQTVAEQFNLSAASVQQGQQAIEEGRQEETESLTAAAGSVEAARQIVEEYAALEALRERQGAGQATAEQVQAQQAELERLIQQAGGAAGRQLLGARERRWQAENGAVAEAALQPVEYAAYQRAPRYYWFRRYLDVLRTTMADKRKFLLMSDDASPLIDFDFTETIDALSNLSIPQRGEAEE